MCSKTVYWHGVMYVVASRYFFNVLFTSSFDLSLFSYVMSGKYTNDTALSALLQVMFDLLF